jgi:hypothetical protein
MHDLVDANKPYHYNLASFLPLAGGEISGDVRMMIHESGIIKYANH